MFDEFIFDILVFVHVQENDKFSGTPCIATDRKT